ncbi:hypothetical protein FOZ62_014114, partial [Perkinsus olseni]
STTALILQRIHEAMTTGPGYRRGDIVCIETDVASAFRHIPIRPADRKYCVNCINTPSGPRLLAHKRLPFGLRSSPLLWVRPCASEARLAKRIFAECDNRAEGLQLHIDDRNYFCLRIHATRRLIGLLLLDAVLGMQDFYEKIRVSDCPVILGFQWNLRNNTVGIAKGKAEAIVSDIERILAATSGQSKAPVPLLKTVTGRLSWACHVAKLLKPPLRSLYACKAVAERLACRTIALSEEAKSDLDFFRTVLREELSDIDSYRYASEEPQPRQNPSKFSLGMGVQTWQGSSRV